MEVFEEARKELCFPPVKLRFVDGDRVRLNFHGRRRKPEVEAGRKLFLKHSRSGLKGLFQLSLARWIKHPYSLKVALLEEFWLRDFEKRRRIKELFDTIVCTLYLVRRGCYSVRDAVCESLNADRADEVVKAYLEAKTGLKFCGKDEGDVEKLMKIQFERCSNLSTLRQNLISFARIIEDLIEEEEEEAIELSINASSAIQEVAGEVGVKEFREISEYFGVGRGKGKEKLADVQWYLRRSARYSVKIEGKSRGGEFPGKLVDFSPENGLDYFSPVESLGKVLPGIAKMHEPEGFEGISTGVKNAVVVLDSSGSMKDPESCSSAVIGAFAIARKYIESGGKVGVVNFSWQTKCLKPSRGEEVYRAIAEYQGGGTELNVEEVYDYVSKFARGYDFILITDAGIDNLGEVSVLLERLKGLGCKNYVIWIASKAFKSQQSVLSKHARVITVEREEDIPKIVLSMG